jgi:hypothetical protein
MKARTIKPWWLFAAFLSGLTLAMWAEDLILNWRDNRLEITAPRLHFLGGGKSLERLHNGASVPFNFQVTIFTANKSRVFLKLPEQFVVSYDLWEETFKVVKTQAPRKFAAHLSSVAAEKWCLEQLQPSLSGLGEKELLWVSLDIRAEDGKDGHPLFGRAEVGPPGISLTSLIDLFSRPPLREQSHWQADAGPLSIEEMKNSRRRF